MTDFDWYLDEIRTTDKAAYLEHFLDPDIHKHTLNIPFPYTDADFDYWFALKIKETTENGTPVSFGIRRRDGFLIGGIGFDGLKIGKTHAAEIGYWLAKPYWNKGIMTSAVKEACKTAFSDFGLVRVQACVFLGNQGSARVLEKCGFAKEGLLRKYVVKNGHYLDIELFSLIS